MALTQYEAIKEINWKDATWDNKHWEETAPYFYKGDIESLLNQKYFAPNGDEIPIKAFQVCAVKVPDKNNKLHAMLVLVGLIELDGELIRVTNNSRFKCENNASDLIDKNGQLLPINQDKVLIALSCRPVNNQSKVFLSNPEINNTPIPPVKID